MRIPLFLSLFKKFICLDGRTSSSEIKCIIIVSSRRTGKCFFFVIVLVLTEFLVTLCLKFHVIFIFTYIHVLAGLHFANFNFYECLTATMCFLNAVSVLMGYYIYLSECSSPSIFFKAGTYYVGGRGVGIFRCTIKLGWKDVTWLWDGRMCIFKMKSVFQ